MGIEEHVTYLLSQWNIVRYYNKEALQKKSIQSFEKKYFSCLH